MTRVIRYADKLRGHYAELGPVHGTVWFLRAVRFRTMMKMEKVLKINLRRAGNVNTNKTLKGHLPKTGRQVFIFASIPYYDIGGGQRAAQLAKTLNLFGFRVHYIYSNHCAESKIHRMEIPTLTHKFIDDYTETAFGKLIDADDLVIVEFPNKKFLPFLRIAKTAGAKIVYENIDNWETSLGATMFERKNLNQILKLADLLVGTAEFLVEQLKGYCRELKLAVPIIYSPNAVDDVLFAPKIERELPEDFVKGEKTLLYYGSLWGEWFDWDLLFGVAKAFPKYSILLIGEKENIRQIVDKAPKNVHFLGTKKQADLPAYLQYCDYSLIPFKVDKIGKAVSPLKIFEYISMNTMVLSTSLPEVTKYPNTLCGDTVAEWCRLLKQEHNVDESARNRFMDSNIWYSRCAQILRELGEKPQSLDDKLSVVVLNHNNADCICECIDSLMRHSAGMDCEIIVVDNDSTDGSYEILKQKYAKKIRLIKNKQNGCSSGRNLGAKAAKGKYLLFLDSDQFIKHDYWLDQFVQLIERDEVGAIGWAAGWVGKKGSIEAPIVDYYPYRAMRADMLSRWDVDYLGSGGMLLRRAVFDEIGGFDERFDPTCYEDTDLSFAIRNKNYQIHYCPYLGVFHLPHQTTNGGELNHKELLERHRELFLAKWREISPQLFKHRK